MFDNKYPYTDFHELNLDWFLAEFKKVYDHVDNLQHGFDTLTETVNTFTSFVTNYFDNLDVQQEINHKLDVMAADGTLSALLEPFFNSFSSELQQEVDDFEESVNNMMGRQNMDILALQGRMDEFSTLTEGSTTGDAELADIRVAYNGNTYPSAGDAVRAQAQNAISNIENVADDLGVKMLQRMEYQMSDGYYSMVNKIFNSSQSYRSAVIEASPFDEIYVSGLTETNIPLAMFYSGTPSEATYLSCQGNYATSTQYTRELLDIPTGCTHIAINTKNDSTGTGTDKNVIAEKYVYYNQVEALLSDDNIEEVILTPTIQPGLYSIATQAYANVPNYRCCFIECKDTDTIYVTTTTNLNCPICMFYNDDSAISANYITYQGNVVTSTSYVHEKLNIPKGCNHIAINCFGGGNTFAIYKEELLLDSSPSSGDGIQASWDGTTLSITQPFSAGTSAIITMTKRGGNTLFDFNSVALSGAINKTLITNNTDWFMPYMIQAVNDDDGDKPTGWQYQFVGGNHQFNNAGSGSTATARCVLDAVLFNNEDASTFTGNIRFIDVYWTNYVQGNNTKKLDGTGREILKERFHLHYDGLKFKIDHYFEALEDIICTRYYGTGFYYVDTDPYYYEYISGSDRELILAPGSTNSGNKNCRNLSIISGDIKITNTMNELDLGSFDKSNQTYSCFTSGQKMYFDLIDGTLNIPAGSRFYYQAEYDFNLPW